MTDSDIQQRDQRLLDLVGGIKVDTLSQGAEALIFIAHQHPYNADIAKCIVKYRPTKTYRHPTLDARLTKHRTLAEARILHKLHGVGVPVPKLYFVDPAAGLIWMELVNGLSLKQWIWDNEEEDSPPQNNIVLEVLHRVGREISRMHLEDIVHGDLTSSNILLDRQPRGHVPVLIDFGLSSQSSLAEDKAVDLYVLERAIQSTHPKKSDVYNEELLRGYSEGYKQLKAQNKLKETMARLEQVRLRGRKRSMVG